MNSLPQPNHYTLYIYNKPAGKETPKSLSNMVFAIATYSPRNLLQLKKFYWCRQSICKDFLSISQQLLIHKRQKQKVWAPTKMQVNTHGRLLHSHPEGS